MHVHIGLPEVVQFVAMLALIGFLWRSVAGRLSDNPIGKAMAFIY
jgi:hypothetical protein